MKCLGSCFTKEISSSLTAEAGRKPKTNKHKTKLKKQLKLSPQAISYSLKKVRLKLKPLELYLPYRDFPVRHYSSTEVPASQGILRKQNSITITQVTKWDKLSPSVWWNFQQVPSYSKNKGNTPNWERTVKFPDAHCFFTDVFSFSSQQPHCQRAQTTTHYALSWTSRKKGCIKPLTHIFEDTHTKSKHLSYTKVAKSKNLHNACRLSLLSWTSDISTSRNGKQKDIFH